MDQAWDVDYDEPEMRPLPLVDGIVVVRAQMGAGKTKALKAYVNARPEASIMVVTFSRALAAKLVADFVGFYDYQKRAGQIVARRVVVCLDSLHRVALKRFDVVILDEAVSVLLHFNSPLMSRAAENVALMDAHAAACGTLFLVDAAVDLPFVRRIVKHFESSREGGFRALWIRNRFVRETNRRLAVYAKPKAFAAHDVILAAVREGQRVVVCSSTKRFVLELEERAARKCPSKRVVVHYGGTKSADEEPLTNVDDLWGQADLLVYSPSVSAGVSFEGARFDRLFANFVCSRYTPGVEIALQQLYRVRKLANGAMTVFYSAFGASKAPTNVDDPDFRGLNPKIKGAVDHTTPLGRLIAQGVLDMRKRSDDNFLGILTETLRRDHGVREA